MATNNMDIPYINRGQIDGRHSIVLYHAPILRLKLLVCVIINTQRFHVTDHTVYVVTKDDAIIHQSGKACLSINFFNSVIRTLDNSLDKIKTPEPDKGKIPLKSTSICKSCDKQDNCNAFLRGTTEHLKTCASFKPLIG
jgi:hypothetical protein